MDRTKKRLLQIGLLVLAIALLGVGIWRGEVTLVLNKAINICLECIGLG